MIKLSILGCAVSVRAGALDPTDFDPEFHRRHEVAGRDWLVSKATVNPMQSVVMYDSGVNISVLPGYLQVFDGLVESANEFYSRAFTRAGRAVVAAPAYTGWTALELFASFLSPDYKPLKFLCERTLRAGLAKAPAYELTHLEQEFIFGLGGASLSLTLKPTSVLLDTDGGQEDRTLVGVQINYSRKLARGSAKTPFAASERVMEAIEVFDHDWRSAVMILSDLLNDRVEFELPTSTFKGARLSLERTARPAGALHRD